MHILKFDRRGVLMSSSMSVRESQVQNSDALDLVLLQSPFPDSCIWCHAILAEIHQDIHAILVHRLSLVDIVVVPITQNFLSCSWCFGLELLDVFCGSVLLLQLLGQGLHVF